jgi:hypothetical protein
MYRTVSTKAINTYLTNTLKSTLSMHILALQGNGKKRYALSNLLLKGSRGLGGWIALIYATRS